jgi:hypothetical protein
MATRGFEYAYALDGSEKTPVIRDFTMGTASLSISVGDLMKIDASGYVVPASNTIGECTGIAQEAFGTASISVGTTQLRTAILTREQVWKCSINATSTAFVVGYTKTIDCVDRNTISATDSSGGSMILVDKSELDDDGNVLAYVVFADTTFGNT